MRIIRHNNYITIKTLCQRFKVSILCHFFKKDVNYICGNALDSNVLLEAGISDADLLISVTNMDEQNVMCCLLGKTLGVKHTTI